jgi:cobyrinic acid a,c-diamide synthase
MMTSPNAFLISGTHSGAGKTTATLALLSLLVETGYEPQAFKSGPDFIDPGFHKLATGKDSYNLDPWMMGGEGIRRCFARHGETVRVVEGMGGLFDGQDGTELGSSAWLAKELGIPIVLVVDAWGMTRSTGAVIEGFMRFDPDARIAGVILNRIGSQRHYEMIVQALSTAVRDLVYGYIPFDADVVVKERHLGLTTAVELGEADRLKTRLLESCRRTVRWDDLWKALNLTRTRREIVSPGQRKQEGRSRIGIASDEAFCFYYQENLDLLEEAGAELVRFSPIRDSQIPLVDGLYFGGGYPEIFARELSGNAAMKDSIARAARGGMPIYGECGGMMYLGNAIQDFDGTPYEMVGAIPASFAMDSKFLAIKYIEIETQENTLLGPQGTRVRGQEFHQSKLVGEGAPGCYLVRTSDGQVFKEGLHFKNVLASYLHLHFRSNPEVPANFVEAGRCYRERHA